MRVLLTGANGFIGHALLQQLVANHDVIAIVRDGHDAAVPASFVTHDLTTPLPVSALPEHVDAVVHLAQSRRYREFPDGADDVFAVNTHSTLELLEYARRAEATCFVYASSGGIYGHSYERLAESDPVTPLNFYLTSKYAAELLIANYETFFRTIVLRPFFVYGPGQQGMLVSSLIEKVRAGEEIVVDGDPGIRINPTFLDDAVSAFESALVHPTHGLFNVAGDDVVTMTELVEAVAHALGRAPVVSHRDSETAGDLVGDNVRMRDVLGVAPRTSLAEGLAKTVAALRATA